jgi:hypothetical protein
MPTIIPSEEITQEREHRAWQMRLQFCTQAEIAAELGVTQGAVSQMLKRVRQRLAQEFAEEAAEMRAEQTEQLFALLRELYLAWQQTKPPAAPQPAPSSNPEAEEQREIPQPPPSVPTSSTPIPEKQQGTKEEGSSIHPSSFLLPPSQPKAGGLGYPRMMLQAMSAVRSLWGLDAPKKAEVTQPVPYVEPTLSPEMQRIREEYRRLRDGMQNPDVLPQNP